jgi:hypothetical protein
MSNSESEGYPFIFITWRHAGLTLLTSIKGYSSVLQNKILGEVSNTQRKALQMIHESCESPWESWLAFKELMEQNKYEKVVETLKQVDDTGQSYLETQFANKALASLETMQQQLLIIQNEAQNLSDEQRKYIEIINDNCKREMDLWKEVIAYYL